MVDVVLSTSTYPQSGTQVLYGTAGEAIAAGSAVYLDSTGLVKKCVGSAALSAACIGISVTGANAANQPIGYVRTGVLVTSGLTQGTPYFIAPATAGALAPVADVDTANSYSTFVGVAVSATVLNVNPLASGVTL